MALTLIYDDTCPLCRRSRRFAEALDWFGRLTFVGLSDQAFIRKRFPGLDGAALAEALHVVDGRGRIFRGFRAFRRVLWVNPATWLPALCLYIPGVPFLGDRVYRRIAAHR